MSQSANYSVIFDAEKFRKDLRQVSWHLPHNADLGSPSILAFMLRIQTPADTVNFRVRINGHSVFHFTFYDNSDSFPTNRYGPWMEVVQKEVLLHGENIMNFDFETDEDDSYLSVSDAVLWWQANN